MFEQCYYGPQKQYRVTKLSPASKYSFRLAAKNDMGVRCVCCVCVCVGALSQLLLDECGCKSVGVLIQPLLEVPFSDLCPFTSCCSEFSEPVDMLTSCGVPTPPKSPELLQAGVTWLCLQWNRPESSPKEDDIGYVLEMEEEGSVRTQHTQST